MENNISQAQTIAAKKAVLEQLKKLPLVYAACQKAQISRATFYRWCSEDSDFKKEAEGAMTEGEEFITDMSESQLISLIKSKNFPAISLWLRTHHEKYANKVRIEGELTTRNELAPEEQEDIQKALSLMSGAKPKSKKNHE